MRYKAGDRVRVRKDLTVGNLYGGVLFNKKKCSWLGKIVEISEAYTGYYRICDGALSCQDGIKEWAESEYVGRPVISKSDRRFLDCIGNTYKYIARDRDGKLFVCKKVYAVNDEWFSRGCVAGSDYTYISGFDVHFPMVKRISSTVWLIEDLKKLEVVEAY